MVALNIDYTWALRELAADLVLVEAWRPVRWHLREIAAALRPGLRYRTLSILVLELDPRLPEVLIRVGRDL